VITGAARGQGAAEARNLASLGVAIVAVDVRPEASVVADDIGASVVGFLASDASAHVAGAEIALGSKR